MRLISVSALAHFVPVNAMESVTKKHIKTSVSGFSLITTIVTKALRFECTLLYHVYPYENELFAVNLQQICRKFVAN